MSMFFELSSQNTATMRGQNSFALAAKARYYDR